MEFFESTDSDSGEDGLAAAALDVAHAIVDAALVESEHALACPYTHGEALPSVAVIDAARRIGDNEAQHAARVELTAEVRRVLKLRGFNALATDAAGADIVIAPTGLASTAARDAVVHGTSCMPLPGGKLVVVCATATGEIAALRALLDAQRSLHPAVATEWNVERARDDAATAPIEISPGFSAVVLYRRVSRCNFAAATGTADRGLRYQPGRRPEQRWPPSDGTAGFVTTTPEGLNESATLARVTVALSASERGESRLSDRSHRRAVAALRSEGVVVIRGLFSAAKIAAWGDAAVADLHDASVLIKATHGIALQDVGDGHTAMEFNFTELAMRESRRFDLRRSPRLLKLAVALEAREAAAGGRGSAGERGVESESVCGSGGEERVHGGVSRTHPSIVAIVSAVMNPRDQIGEGARGGSSVDDVLTEGNWGAWNFGGGGPGSAPATADVSEVGTVLSLPGCEDQAVHADTPHLYEHMQLPPHYVNLFLPAVSSDAQCDASVGQTAWVTGTHKLAVAARLMGTARPDRHRCAEFLHRLIRPHLSAGDAVLFDTRTLHFGLANRSGNATAAERDTVGGGGGEGDDTGGATRPVLYINYTQPWWNRKRVDKNFEKRPLWPGAVEGKGGEEGEEGEEEENTVKES